LDTVDMPTVPTPSPGPDSSPSTALRWRTVLLSVLAASSLNNSKSPTTAATGTMSSCRPFRSPPQLRWCWRA
jgi:hypothetical protein